MLRFKVFYILGKADFFGRVFTVNPSVLIPRPETELLIDEIVKETSNAPGKVLDIGTGSGCIAITLAKELPDKTVIAFDISEAALKTASANATELSAQVDFRKMNILTEGIPFNDLEIIVSNPPYVTVSEKHSMNNNVLNHEPHLALFVPDNDPLVFYKAIAAKGFAAVCCREKPRATANRPASIPVKVFALTATIITTAPSAENKRP